MTENDLTPNAKRTGFYSAAILIAALALFIINVFKDRHVEYIDAIRYITYSLNLLYHGNISEDTFSISSESIPSLIDGGPLIAIQLSVAGYLDQNTLDFFQCIVSRGDETIHCDGYTWGLYLFDVLLTAFAFGVLWLIGWNIFRSSVAASLTVLVASIMEETSEFVGIALTEPHYFLLTTVLAYLMMQLAEGRVSARVGLATGLVVGLTVLSKPVAAPLIALIPLLVILDALITRKSLGGAAKLSAMIAIPALFIIVPWMARNYAISGFVSLADPFYLEASLAHRFGYNQMSWAEWAVGWIYYLPDFGDSLARGMFAPSYYERLGWSDGSFYHYGVSILHPQVRQLFVSVPGVSYLIEHHAFSDTLKYLSVSALLMWRGIMVGSYIGLAAVLFAPFLFVLTTRDRRRTLLYVLFPGLMIAGLNANLSVSITRYNLALVPFIATCIVFILAFTFNWVWRRSRISKAVEVSDN